MATQIECYFDLCSVLRTIQWTFGEFSTEITADGLDFNSGAAVREHTNICKSRPNCRIAFAYFSCNSILRFA